MAMREEKIKVEVYLVPEEFEILKEISQGDKITMAQCMREAFLVDAVTRGNIKALKLQVARGAELMKKKWQQYGLVPAEVT